MSHNVRQIRLAAVVCTAGVLLAGAAGVYAAPNQREADLIKTLKSNASRAEKDKACRELQVVGTRACIPALAALLGDKDHSHMARYALEPMPYAEAGKALRDALDKTSGTTKVGVITSLGFRRDGAATAQLAKLVSGRDQDIAAAATAALGRIGTADATRAIGRLRQTATGKLRAAAAEASLTAAERLVAQGKRADAATIWEDLQGAKWPAHIRLGAFVGLLSAGGDKAADRAIAAIGGNDRALRAVAIANSRSLKGPGIGKRLAAELGALPPDAQVLLIGALVQRGDPAVRPEIIKAAGNASDRVRTAALGALGKVGDAACVALLCRAVATGKSDAEKQAAVNSLQSLRGEKVNANILASLAAAPAEAKVALIETLAIRQAPGAVGALVKEAGGADAPVRAAALKALGQLATSYDLTPLVNLLVARPSEEAERAVVLVSRRLAPVAAQAECVLEALGKAKTTPIRCSLLRVLGGIGNAKAFAAVTAAKGDKDADVQNAAVRALTGWPNARALTAALDIFRTSESMTHRVLALRGCVRMVGLTDLPSAAKLKILSELMNKTKRPQDRQLVLSGLANVADLAALAAVEPFLRDGAVRDEAELAMLAIARGIMSTAPSQAKAAAQKLRRSRNRTISRGANRLIRDIDALPAWTPLFNGKDLTGWRETGSAIFKVEGGNLVGTQTTGKGGDLWTDAEFDDFELQVTYRVVWPANSGFWFRHNGRKGYQYDVLKYKRPVAFSGSLYCPGKMFIIKNLNESLEKRDGWNEARVRAAGDELTLWLNGTKTGTVKDNLLKKGRIGIQVHPGNGFKGMKIIIKKMEVRLLKAQGGS